MYTLRSSLVSLYWLLYAPLHACALLYVLRQWLWRILAFVMAIHHVGVTKGRGVDCMIAWRHGDDSTAQSINTFENVLGLKCYLYHSREQ